jgi:hypothetical protein
MQAFSPELLTILSLISICWAGVTCIGVLIIFIVFICLSCSKRQGRVQSVKPIQSRSTSSSLTVHEPDPLISPVSIRTPIKNLEQQKHHYDTNSVTNEHSYSYNRYQQQEYMHDENDDTTKTDQTRLHGHRHHKRQYQSVKPMTDIRIMDRHTPYPPDVIAREKLMNNTRFPIDNKY